MLILMGAYGEGHLIGTQIALPAALAAAPDLERMRRVNRNDVVGVALRASGSGVVGAERTDRHNVAAFNSLGAAWPLVHARSQRTC